MEHLSEIYICFQELRHVELVEQVVLEYNNFDFCARNMKVQSKGSQIPFQTDL